MAILAGPLNCYELGGGLSFETNLPTTSNLTAKLD